MKISLLNPTRQTLSSAILPLLILAVTLGCGFNSYAESLAVSNNQELKLALTNAQDGDRIILDSGRYQGPVQIHQSITLTSLGDSIIDANGVGSAITVFAANVELSGLRIENWGNDHYERDAGILLEPGSHGVKIHNNHLRGDGFGIRADELNNIQINDNVIVGNNRLYILDRGDGIHLQHVTGSVITGNTISQVRDGVYLESSSKSKVFDNQLFDQQYGIHYMYTMDDEAFNNQSYQVDGGYALMNSKRIHLHRNQVWDAIDFGILLNMTEQALVDHNRVERIVNRKEDQVLGQEGKGIFVYGARDNTIINNHFAHSDIGFYMAMGGEGNQVYQNQFIDNFSQVKYVGDSLLEWSHAGRGNYWSGYLGWDHNLDGVGNTAYRPNDNIDKLFWLYPEANFLMDSAIVVVLRWVQRQFEIGEPSGIIDSFPLLTPNPAFNYQSAVANR
ncbi:nitrous oxide reductase family maturation protein NosD [Shewanella sp. Isolate13]|uniref:nitrous oxide reductase family maturation protein NosD n=1 Tax=Shewanella sp. Isolate13 TaxID=2908531 RepID=UPI001EFC7F54|nr:nitrous oxide reductase family maturation protein NosD [Shewanella sp. Isolate13]MCG9728414.1 nitrous oxide reductase family maturation protein NosD [Shewanella sp. Isolate13]